MILFWDEDEGDRKGEGIFSYRDAGKMADGGVGGQGSKGDHFDVVVMTSEF